MAEPKKQRNSRGRPYANSPRKKALWVRLTEDEARRIQGAAEAKGLTVSAYLRMCALRGVK